MEVNLEEVLREEERERTTGQLVLIGFLLQ